MYRQILAVAALVVTAAPAPAQQPKVLDLVPDDALGFIVVNDLRRLSDHVENAAKQLGAEKRVSLLELIQTEIGVRDGLNDRGSAVFVVLPGKDENAPPTWIFAAAVSDYGKVAGQLGVRQPRDGINEGRAGAQPTLLAGIGLRADEKTKKVPVLLGRRGDFVLIAPPEDRAALRRVLDSKKSIAAAVEPAREWLAEQDIGGVCTNSGVRQVGLVLMGAGVGGSTPAQAEYMKESFAEAEKNVKLIAFGGRIEKPGHWRLSTRVHFDPQGSYAKWIAGARPADGKALAALPDQTYLLAAMARISPQMNIEGRMRLLTESLPRDTADRLTRAAARLVQRMSEVGLAVYVSSVAKKGSIPLTLGVVARVDDAPAFITGTVDLLKQAREATKGKDSGEVTFRQTKLAGRPGWVIRYMDKGEPKKEGRPANSALEGTLALVELDPHTVFAAGTLTPDQADGLVKKVAGGSGPPLTGNAGIHKTAALLPEKSQSAAYLDVRPLATLFGNFSMPENPADCPPVGFAVRTLPAGIEAQFVIPFEAIRAVFKAANEKSDAPNKK